MGNVVAAGLHKDTTEQNIAVKYHFFVVGEIKLVQRFLLVFSLRNGRNKRLMLKCVEVHEWMDVTLVYSRSLSFSLSLNCCGMCVWSPPEQ